MAAEGRSFIYPTEHIGFGARVLSVPKRGNTLCASAFFPFKVSTGEPAKPAEWYKAVTNHGGDLAIPDTMAPLPGAEILVFGCVPPVADKKRKAYLRCGAIHKKFTLYANPEAPASPILADHTTAAWHEKENPDGRGGKGKNKDKTPLIVNDKSPSQPLWLGQTTLDHPSRLALSGVPSEDPSQGWAKDTDPSILYETHSAFWGKSLHPGDPLAYEGLTDIAIDTQLPLYRMAITSGHMDGSWVVETTRIHAVVLIPAADLATVIWRASIDLAEEDVLGADVICLAAALQDVEVPEQDAEHWGDLVAERWTEPETALDNRPFLPVALSAGFVSPFAVSEDDPVSSRYDLAKEWVQDETGAPETNPFEGAVSEESELSKEIETTLNEENGPLNTEKIDELASSVLALGKKRHEDAGFPEPDASQPRDPEVRAETLEMEIKKRLDAPYCSKKETAIAQQVQVQENAELDAPTLLKQMADGRQQSPEPQLFWPAFNDEEASQFGAKLIERLNQDTLKCHIDISGVIVDSSQYAAAISGQIFTNLLAEETKWREVSFQNCEFIGSTFVASEFQNCTFDHCIFAETNLSKVKLTGCKFVSCTLKNLQLIEPIWLTSSFRDCIFTTVCFTQLGMRNTRFVGGSWEDVQFIEGVMAEVLWSQLSMKQITFNFAHVPNSTFEYIEMFKFWAMGKGFPGCTFKDVQAKTCGFLAGCHFDEANISATHFAETGFNTVFFKDMQIARGCQFSACDFTASTFENATIEGVRFLRCTMAMTTWTKTKAAEAWFFESIVRGVDFTDTELTRAVFADADVEETKFRPDCIIGADFRGTTKMNG